MADLKSSTSTKNTAQSRAPLYHYTSIEAFISIVEHKTLRATNVYYMNDASESDLGLGLIRKAAEEARNRVQIRLFSTSSLGESTIDTSLIWVQSK